MGITNTISELSNYFYQWHKNKYNEIHQSTVDTQNTIYEAIFGTNGIKGKVETLTTNFNSLLNRYNTLTANSNSTIANLESNINANKTSITNLNNNKADKSAVSRKSWTSSQQIGDWNIDGEYHASTVVYNEDIHIGRLYVYAPIKSGKAYNKNSTGYTDFLQVDVSIPTIKPSSNYCTYSANGKNKLKFDTDGKVWCAFSFNVDKYSYPTARGTLLFAR